MIEITRYHDISMGHRVYGHESKCAHLHGHNYRFHFTVRPKIGLDNLGRVIDFGVVKERLVVWLEKEWDHRMMLWDCDPIRYLLHQNETYGIKDNSVVIVPFNPTAENIAEYFLEEIAPMLFKDDDVYLHSLTIDETAKCSATVTLDTVPYFTEAPLNETVQPDFPPGFYCEKGNGNCDCRIAGKPHEEIKVCNNSRVDLPF
jgi:6-pyruvoyltetrahydropterin/6-carboxytetrahydropterin synthase